MNQYVLRTNNLYKKYKEDYVLDDVNVEIKKGEIYGFIGQNGAGKTTLLRIVTGLAFPTKGDIELFGKSREKDLMQSIKRIGAVIESPALFPNMTAYENLELHRLQKGIPNKKSIEKTLELVDDKTGEVVVNFSLDEATTGIVILWLTCTYSL